MKNKKKNKKKKKKKKKKNKKKKKKQKKKEKKKKKKKKKKEKWRFEKEREREKRKGKKNRWILDESSRGFTLRSIDFPVAFARERKSARFSAAGEPTAKATKDSSNALPSGRVL